MDDGCLLNREPMGSLKGRVFSSVSGELFLILKCFLVCTKKFMVVSALAALPISR